MHTSFIAVTLFTGTFKEKKIVEGKTHYSTRYFVIIRKEANKKGDPKQGQSEQEENYFSFWLRLNDSFIYNAPSLRRGYT